MNHFEKGKEKQFVEIKGHRDPSRGKDFQVVKNALYYIFFFKEH